jgi:hypothetical protein
VLPQVLAGLGLFGLLSAGCLFWLERLQPLFLIVAIGALVYQGAIINRRPPSMRTPGIKAIFGVSVVLNFLLIGVWIVISYRYQ